jgi:hypothetical protein
LKAGVRPVMTDDARFSMTDARPDNDVMYCSYQNQARPSIIDGRKNLNFKEPDTI